MPSLEPRGDLVGVVDPAHVVGVAVGGADRLAEDRPLVGPQEPEPRVNCLAAALHGLYIRLLARLAQLVEHLICNQEVAGSSPDGGLRNFFLPSRFSANSA